jgi:succinate-acetate transporter protein
MQRVLISVPDGSRSVSVAQDHAMTELSAMTTCRRTRLLENQLSLPTVLWFVLVVGGVLTIVSSCMFGSQNRFLHGVQVLFFSLMIALALLAIADINKPFRGSVHVGNDAFVRALENMK